MANKAVFCIAQAEAQAARKAKPLHPAAPAVDAVRSGISRASSPSRVRAPHARAQAV